MRVIHATQTRSTLMAFKKLSSDVFAYSSKGFGVQEEHPSSARPDFRSLDEGFRISSTSPSLREVRSTFWVGRYARETTV